VRFGCVPTVIPDVIVCSTFVNRLVRTRMLV
jgi:hypothetical protein